MIKNKTWFIISFSIAVLSFILLKVMYIIDPVGEDTGYLTMLVFCFVVVPMWLWSFVTFVVPILFIIRDKRKQANQVTESVPHLADSSIGEDTEQAGENDKDNQA